MDGAVNVCVFSSMWPWLVAEQAKARFGSVSVGTEEYQWSQTAYPLASADSTGSASGAKQPMMSLAVVPGTIDQPPSRVCQPRVYAKFVTKPSLAGTVPGLAGPLLAPNSWELVAM